MPTSVYRSVVFFNFQPLRFGKNFKEEEAKHLVPQFLQPTQTELRAAGSPNAIKFFFFLSTI